ncbi:MAG: hypothetical protein ACPHIA_07125 [Alphaproteobacteria bacterium]
MNELREEPEASFTEEDLAAAREEGMAEGKAAGRKEAEAETERLTADALKKISEHMATLGAAQSEASKSNAREASELAMAVARKVMPEISKHGAIIEIEAMVRQCLADRFEEPRVVIRVHDSLLDSLRTRIDSAAANAGFAGKLVLLADDSLQGADCRVEWADGGAERDEERLWKDIEESARRLIGQLEKDSSFRVKPRSAPSEVKKETPDENEASTTAEATDAPATTENQDPEEPSAQEAPAEPIETEDLAEIEASESRGENHE